MRKSKNEFAIGLTLLLALAILVVGILWGKQYSLTTGRYEICVRFGDIAGLEIGAPVLVNGIRKGKVLDFILEQESVVVCMNLTRDVVLYTDAVFEVTTPELMGGKVINIFPGVSGEVPEAEYVFAGEVGGGMNRLMKMSTELVGEVRHLTKALEETIENVNKTAGDPKLREALISSIENFDRSAQRTLEIISLNEDKLTSVMDNLVISTTAIRTLLEDNSAELDKAAVDIQEFAARLNETGDRLDQLSQKIESGEGAVSMLINDPEFAEDLRRTLADLHSLVLKIKDEGIQTNISLFGRRK